jgi:hypothetical protein
MPLEAVSVNNIVFLDPTDPRIPYYRECAGSSMYKQEAMGWKKSNVLIITKEETAAAKAAGKGTLKPYNSPDSTNQFFSNEYPVQELKYSYSSGFYNDEGYTQMRRELETADKLRIFYADWANEEKAHPEWYKEIPGSGIMDLVKGGPGTDDGWRYLEDAKARAMSLIKDRVLSDGKTRLSDLANKYYDLLIKARKAWWNKYDELLKSAGSVVALREAKDAENAVLKKTGLNGGGKRKTRGAGRFRKTRRS